MSAFPTLKTGAVLQYPAQRSNQFSTQVLRFLDGTEQRFRNYSSPLRRWVVKVDLLDEAELHSLREFFRTQSGAAETFSFTDPWDNTVYPTCNLQSDTMAETLTDKLTGMTSLVIRETRA